MIRRVAFALAVALAFGAAGCSGSGAGSIPAAPSGGGADKQANVAFTLMIPSASAAGAAKRRAFVSPSANGAVATTYAHSDTAHTTPLGSSTTDISAGSGACTTVSGGRSCTIGITAPAGSDDFVFTIYDAAPVSGAIPATAHVLGVAGATETIAAGVTNTVSAAVSAVIAGFSGSTATVKEAADGHTHTVALVVAPTDFGNNPISAGASNAPYANPISATVNESGGSGHTLLELNGGTPAASVTLTKASDTVQAVYDGGGVSGYAATVTLTATAVGGQGGATTESLALAPVLFVTNPTVFYSPSPAQLNTYPQGQHILSISEPSAAGGTTYTAAPSGCSNILSVGTIVGTGTSATLLVVGGTQVSTSGCSLAISDGTVSFTVNVTNAVRSFNSGSSPAITEYPTAAQGPIGIVTGADGNLWFTEATTAAISSIKPDGTGYTQHLLVGDGFSSPWGDTLGPDGNVWFGDYDTNLVGKITTSGTISVFSGQSQEYTNAFAAGLDGNIWFSECDGPVVGSIQTSTGTLTEITTPNSGAPYGVALGADGAVWFSDFGNLQIGRISGGVASEFAASTSEVPGFMSAGADGAMWFAEGDTIGRMDASGNLTEYPVSGSTPQIGFITAGPDGALWFADCGDDAIGRITTAGAITEYVVPTVNAGPQGITVGPDGNIWFTENDTGAIGVLKL